MALSSNHFAQLAGEVRAGNANVKAQIRRELEPCLRRIVARALASGESTSPLHNRIRAVTRQLGEAGAVPDRQRLAQVLCQRVLSRIAPTNTDFAPQGTLIG